MKKQSICVLAMLALIVFAFNGTAFGVACSETSDFHGDVYRYKISWTSSAGGAYTCTTSNPINGFVYQFLTDPGAGGDAPTANYDISITNTVSGQDIDGGALDDRSASTSEIAYPTFGGSPCTPSNFGTLDIAVTNAGSANTGVLYLYILK